MKIATYNINGVNGHLPVLLRWLDESKPDVVCLQELKAPNEKFPLEAINNAGYNAIWHGQKSWNGVAILTRNLPIQEVCRVLPGDDEDLQSRYLEAVVSGITIGCIYLPNGNPVPGPKFDYKLSWLERFTKHASELWATGNPVVLTGDYNAIPTEIDAYKAERWVEDALFRPETRQAFQGLMSQGWTDALRTLYPNEIIYTYWDYFRNAYGRNAGIRIDHFLLSQSLKPTLRNGGVDRQVRGWEKSSDHAPVWVELDWM
ncbi:MAG: exodeoxyribonuclease III [Bacteroidetes bacterium]|nr:exodeoxyribonuclease III [Bacteroidota bacterium]